MFGKRGRIDMRLDALDARIEEVNNKYWSLWHRHDLLLRHLGLSEHKVPESFELRSKGGPVCEPAKKIF